MSARLDSLGSWLAAVFDAGELYALSGTLCFASWLLVVAKDRLCDVAMMLVALVQSRVQDLRGQVVDAQLSKFSEQGRVSRHEGTAACAHDRIVLLVSECVLALLGGGHIRLLFIYTARCQVLGEQ